MLQMDSKGQAYSVFKLLIAAIIAGAILVILLQVIGSINFLAGQDPNETAGSKVQTQINLVGSPGYVENVTFSNGSTLVSKTVADKAKVLSADKVCVGVTPDMPNVKEFSVDGSEDGGFGKSVTYTGTFNQNSRLMVLCDQQRDIAEDLSNFEDVFGFEVPGTDDCEFGDTTAKACVVLVVPDA
ncbi:MAG: hypothetical protein NUV57_02405 [archaeon]|nr:hypothetical protein [archaeon]